ncbi:Uncharacterized damage-inducible protein DinB (forms a four-helix bundle) [Paenibacillus sp. UNC496MF]|uniref:YfiT family bacillithiol transferase n=1 Tax=Paenibacillus sp. UNC496MF TaxID=1502753 RepID=UPI0008F1936C|nr:putative metal-dependent hydrolase [Paenibacillus sp. UNC496MF]SFJ12510.1 Uncharacterized damage-inducible protein DinB (forms a four-helix bundle) [Paenibacillus sp. UNC496MF]
MEDLELEGLRFPLGRFQPAARLGEADRLRLIEAVAGLAGTLRAAVEPLSASRLLTPFRPGGWTVVQVVHHLADADLNAYIRFKRALTEPSPLAATFRENAFAELGDYRDTRVAAPLALLDALHRRFALLLRGLLPEQFARKVTSPTHGAMTLDQAIERFVWHGRHHTAQIVALKARMGWQDGSP